MFKSRQVISATRMIKDFTWIARELESQPQALLITQKSRESLVLVNAEIFESLLQKSLDRDMSEGGCDGIGPPF